MARPLKVGVQLPEVEYDYAWEDLREIATIAEGIGLDSLWVGDHLMYRYPDRPPTGPFEAWTTLAALASITGRVQLGPLVASLGFHSPPMIAKMAATIDRISNGRFILGVGAGWHEPEYTGYGLPFDHRVSRFAEAYSIIRTLFATGTCTFHGKYYDFEQTMLFPKPVQPGGPPLMVGSRGKRMLSATMHSAHMWNAWFADYANNRRDLQSLLGWIDWACDRADRDPATLVRTVAPLVAMPSSQHPSTNRGGRIPALDGRDPAALADELAVYAEMGVSHVQLVLDPITAETVAALEPTLRLLDAG